MSKSNRQTDFKVPWTCLGILNHRSMLLRFHLISAGSLKSQTIPTLLLTTFCFLVRSLVPLSFLKLLFFRNFSSGILRGNFSLKRSHQIVSIFKICFTTPVADPGFSKWGGALFCHKWGGAHPVFR